MSVEGAVLLSCLLVVAVLVALLSKSVSISLIALFYASIALGIIFTIYDSVLVGILQIIVFAGAVSVLLLTAVLMTSESRLNIGSSSTILLVIGTSVAIVAIASFSIVSGVPSSSTSSSTSVSDLFQFVWQYRPWDLLILLVIFASAMVVVTNLFSKETEIEPI